MIGNPRQIGVGERGPPERRRPQHLAGSWFAVFAEEESRGRGQVRMAPSVQNDSGDIASGVEAGAAEHLRELLTNLALIVPERSGKQLGASQVALLFGRFPGMRKQNLDREHGW